MNNHSNGGMNIYWLLATLFLFSCGNSNRPKLFLPPLEKEIKVDGVIDKGEWEQALLIENLIAPWKDESRDETTFRAFVSPNAFNFAFQVMDNTVTTVPFKNELSVEREDRVELFFSRDTTLAKYYCIEIDPNGKVLDYSAKFYREFNQSWNFNSKELASRITENGYIVEGKISINELNELGLSSPFYLGIFRADYKSTTKDDVTWFSWVKPTSSSPDFHIPSAFGEAELKE
jgi:hypothetical protein